MKLRFVSGKCPDVRVSKPWLMMAVQGFVTDECELRSFASRSFRDGKPVLTISELRQGVTCLVNIQQQKGWGDEQTIILYQPYKPYQPSHTVKKIQQGLSMGQDRFESGSLGKLRHLAAGKSGKSSSFG